MNTRHHYKLLHSRYPCSPTQAVHPVCQPPDVIVISYLMHVEPSVMSDDIQLIRIVNQ